jgi:hypothetical protein
MNMTMRTFLPDAFFSFPHKSINSDLLYCIAHFQCKATKIELYDLEDHQKGQARS